MKTRFIFIPVLIFLVLLSACTGDAVDVSEVEFEFTEEEAAESFSEEGFEFSDEEALGIDNEPGFEFDDDNRDDQPGMDFNDDEGDDPPGMDFDDDEALNLSDLPDQLFPPVGASNWLINHHAGTAACPSQTIPIWGSEPEMVTITLGAESQSLIVSGMEGGPEIFYLLEQSGPSGSIYNGYYQPPGASSEVHYQILFSSLADGIFADYLFGSISAEEQGCKISRDFDGSRVD